MRSGPTIYIYIFIDLQSGDIQETFTFYNLTFTEIGIKTEREKKKEDIYTHTIGYFTLITTQAISTHNMI